jgi:hypothetical protein
MIVLDVLFGVLSRHWDGFGLVVLKILRSVWHRSVVDEECCLGWNVGPFFSLMRASR